MSTSTFGPKARTFGDLVAVCRSFVTGYIAFLKLDADSRSDVDQLASSLAHDDLDTHERESLFGTLAQMLFPDLCRTLDGPETQEFCDMGSRETEFANRELDREEDAFAKRLLATMNAMDVTQTALATAIGVRQSAISMMLSRKCRPQRRTVERIADALGITPADLWPDFRSEEIPSGDVYRFTDFSFASSGAMLEFPEDSLDCTSVCDWVPDCTATNRMPPQGAAA